MKATKAPLPLVLASLLSGLLMACHPAVSVHPLAADIDSQVADPRIEGDWESPDFEEIGTEEEVLFRWHIEPTGWGGYTVDMRSRPGNDTKPEEWPLTRYDVELVSLDDRLFFEAEFSEEGLEQETRDASELPLGVVPLPMIGRIWIEKDFLHVALLNSGWIDETTPNGLPYVSVVMPGKDEDLVVITASAEELRQFIARHADTPDAFSYDMYLCRPGTDCAARGFEEMLTRKPNDIETLQSASWLHMNRGNYARAIELRRHAAGLESTDAFRREEVGVTRLFLRDFGGARQEFVAAQRLDPDRTDTGWFVGWSYFLEGDFDEAAKALEAALSFDPHPPAEMILLTYFVLQRKGRLKEAQSMLAEQTARFSGRSDDHLLLLEFAGRITASWWPSSNGDRPPSGSAIWHVYTFFEAQRALLETEQELGIRRLNEIVNAGDNHDLWTLAAHIELERLATRPEVR